MQPLLIFLFFNVARSQSFYNIFKGLTIPIQKNKGSIHQITCPCIFMSFTILCNFNHAYSIDL